MSLATRRIWRFLGELLQWLCFLIIAAAITVYISSIYYNHKRDISEQAYQNGLIVGANLSNRPLTCQIGDNSYQLYFLKKENGDQEISFSMLSYFPKRYESLERLPLTIKYLDYAADVPQVTKLLGYLVVEYQTEENDDGRTLTLQARYAAYRNEKSTCRVSIYNSKTGKLEYFESGKLVFASSQND